MSFSLNEVEATAKKAVRGAGYPWGLAEEAAKATRWLCARDVDGCAALARVLTRFDGTDAFSIPIDTEEAIWKAQTGMLCPIATGAALSDRAAVMGLDGVRIGDVAEPIMLAPFAALCAQQLETIVTVAWTDAVASTDGDQLGVEGSPKASAKHVAVRTGGVVNRPNRRTTRAIPAAKAWDTLNRFAHRTYAPATEESRLKGAGAGLSDND